MLTPKQIKNRLRHRRNVQLLLEIRRAPDPLQRKIDITNRICTSLFILVLAGMFIVNMG